MYLRHFGLAEFLIDLRHTQGPTLAKHLQDVQPRPIAQRFEEMGPRGLQIAIDHRQSSYLYIN